MKKIAIGLLMAAGLAAPAQATVLYGIDRGNNLVSFDSSAPGTLLTSNAISGTTAQMVAIDFRSNGQLFGLGDDARLYRIDANTGGALGAGAPLAISGGLFGFDFNPVIDRIRIVSDTGNNYVVNPNDGTLQTIATDLFYGPADPNFGQTPGVMASAYTQGGVSTQLYGIDVANGILVTQANSAGVLGTVGPIGIASNVTAFDIGIDGVAYATAASGLYQVNLNTGAFTLVGATSSSLSAMSAYIGGVPEPGAWTLMIGGFSLAGASLRRRRAAASPARG